jgi:hypothetical protein
VLEVMPHSVIEIEIVQEEGQLLFRRFFCAFGPCLQGFREGCRPYLSVDFTALNGRWNKYLPLAIDVDGHNWKFPVAFGFFESESKESWNWFLRQTEEGNRRASFTCNSLRCLQRVDNSSARCLSAC